MKVSPRLEPKSNRKIAARGKSGISRPAPKLLWPALVALGNGFALSAHQASALELGDIDVQSALGQPLRASIAYALAPNENIQNHCIFLRPPKSDNGLPTIRKAAASASNGVIRLTGSVPILEPMLNLQLMVDCPGTAHLSRQYFVFVNPASAQPTESVAAADRTQPAAVQQPAAVSRPSAPAAPAPAHATPEHRSRPTATHATPISGQGSYRVQPGDTLSGIASRIADRKISLWAAVDVIFATNPQAFINNDRDLLRAGAVLVLPEMGPVAETTPSVAPVAAPVPSTLSAPPRAEATRSVDSRPVSETSQPNPLADHESTSTSETATTPTPGDISTGPDSPFVTPIEESTDTAADSQPFEPARETIPATRIDTQKTRPAVVASRGSADYDSGGMNSLAWLGGAGVALILGLLLFGRRFRDRFGDALSAGATRGRRRTDTDETGRMAVGEDSEGEIDGVLGAQPVTLDADLDTGSGFDDDGEIDVAQDFGFSTSRDLYGNLDMEFTEEATSEPAQSPTDIVPPGGFEDAVIVEKEVLPSDGAGEYDLSMIVDATRQPNGVSEATTKDLRAVQVDTEDNDGAQTDNYTLSREIDYKILEQDYEDEFTATQALNAKVMQEAELAAQVETEDATAIAEGPTNEYAAVSEELTMQLPGAGDGDDFDVTAEMPMNQDIAEDVPNKLEDSGVNAEVTTELPAADNDATVEMDIETATIDTKKLRAS